MNNRGLYILVALLAVVLIGGAVAFVVYFERAADEELRAEEAPASEIYAADEDVYAEEADAASVPEQEPMRAHRATDLRPEIEFSQGEKIQASREQSVQSALRPVRIIEDAVKKNQ